MLIGYSAHMLVIEPRKKAEIDKDCFKHTSAINRSETDDAEEM